MGESFFVDGCICFNEIRGKEKIYIRNSRSFFSKLFLMFVFFCFFFYQIVERHCCYAHALLTARVESTCLFMCGLGRKYFIDFFYS